MGSKRAKAFIIVVARHLALDMRKKRIREICVDEEDENNEVIFDEGIYDSYFIDENGFSPEMNAYMSRLQEKDRHLLLLRYTYDLPYESHCENFG